MTFQEALFLCLTTIAAFADILTGKIPNWLTYPACVFGVCLAGLSTSWPGLVDSVLGLTLGFGPFFALYLMGGMGGGDVKLMAAVGAMMGVDFVLNAMITSILVGGLIA